MLNIIPEDIIKLSALLGCVLTMILIWNHLRAKHLHQYQEKLERQARNLADAKRDMDKQHAKLEALIEIMDRLGVE